MTTSPPERPPAHAAPDASPTLPRSRRLSPFDRFLHTLLILAVPIALVTLSVRIVATNAAMRLEYSTAEIPPPAAMSATARDAAANATRRYVIGLAPRAEIDSLLCCADRYGKAGESI